MQTKQSRSISYSNQSNQFLRQKIMFPSGAGIRAAEKEQLVFAFLPTSYFSPVLAYAVTKK